LSFSVTTTSTGGYSPGHLLAIWIENSTASFIKSKIRYSSPDNLDHMQTWVNKSNQNVVDAITGPTLTNHGTITFLWNGTDVAGNAVPDGLYSIWLEMAWASSFTTGKTVNSYPFTKGSTTFHSSPANTANFLSMAIDWTPASTPVEGVLENKDIIVYPNPSSGLININFKNPYGECVVEVMNGNGNVVYVEKISDVSAGIKTFDLSSLSDGIYFCRLRFPKEELIFSIILVK
jgi:flagellar hook assembly protein FlgD